jgi:hypothetical protein
MWASSLLVVPTLYAMAMVVAWACVPARGARIAIVSAMSIVPLWIAVHAALKASEMSAIEESFHESCARNPRPEIHATASDVDSVFVNVRTLAGGAAAEDRHPQSVFPQDLSTRFLLQGAVRYPRIERIASWGPLQTVDPRNDGRPAESKTPKSRYSIEWRSIQAPSKYVTTGIMVMVDTMTGKVLGEQRTLLLDSPPVTILGGEDFGFWAFPARKVACPTTRQLVHLVKSVLRPAAAPGT